MAVPVQTWGALGTMVTEQKQFGAESAEYLENNEVYDLFQHLLRQVIIHQPENPIRFLQDQLRAKPPLCVCVIGPPGINRKKYCAQIADDFGIKHIHVGTLLMQKKDLKELILKGDLIEDNTVIEIVNAELAKYKGQGWVLDGFPRTKIQAQTLASEDASNCIDKILMLNTGEKAIRERYAAKVADAGMSAGEKQDLISARLQQYQRHVISIAELFKNIIRQIEVSTGGDNQSYSADAARSSLTPQENSVYSIIMSNLHVRPHSNAPLRSSRICIVGACGSGRTSQCKALAKSHGLVHVDLAVLLRQRQKEQGQMQEEVPPEWVSDEELCAVVGRRLNEIDCLRKGWILDGFPKTQAQAEFLRQAHFWPSRIIHLAVNPETAALRISARRIDPETGTPYYRAPSSVAVRQRLVQAPHDTADTVMARHELHAKHIEAVMSTYPLISSAVVGEAEMGEVTRCLKEKIDTPLPHELAQGAASPDN
jgi:adenylate kinase